MQIRNCFASNWLLHQSDIHLAADVASSTEQLYAVSYTLCQLVTTGIRSTGNVVKVVVVRTELGVLGKGQVEGVKNTSCNELGADRWGR